MEVVFEPGLDVLSEVVTKTPLHLKPTLDFLRDVLVDIWHVKGTVTSARLLSHDGRREWAAVSR